MSTKIVLPRVTQWIPPSQTTLARDAPHAVLFALGCLPVSLGALACQIVLLHVIGPASLVLLVAGLAYVHHHARLAGFVIYIQILMYQNLVISILSSDLESSEYTLTSGISFLTGLTLLINPLQRWIAVGQPFQATHRGIQATVRIVALAIAVALGYTALGMVTAGVMPAVVGFRNASAMLVAILIGLDVGDRWDFRTVATCVLASALLGVGLACIEIADPAWYLNLINAVDFGNFKNHLSVRPHLYAAENVIDTMMALPFNSDLLADMIPGVAYRFGGPNLHSISYGYVLAVSTLLMLSLEHAALAIPLLVLLALIGVKGAAILVVASVLLDRVWRVSRRRVVLWVCGMVGAAFYVGYGIWSGLQHGDFHVIGFLGGINGFLANPFGHGLGMGGNMSLGTLDAGKWQDYQHSGAADVGLESAVGVLLYQMGLGVIVLVAAIVTLMRAGGVKRRPKPTDLLFIGLAVGLVNGVFQEEAYSPYAVGLLALCCAVLVANGQRPPVQLDVPRPSLLRSLAVRRTVPR